MLKRIAAFVLPRRLGLGAMVSLILAGGALGAGRAEAQAPRMQVGPGFAYGLEEPYINVIHGIAEPFVNRASAKGGLALEDMDPETGLPLTVPDGDVWLANVLTGGERDGKWVLEWECETGGGGCADLSPSWATAAAKISDKPGRIVFIRDSTAKHKVGQRIHLTRLKGRLTKLALYRLENEDAYKAGRIFNPRFLEAADMYDIIRTMDLQQTNDAHAVSLDEIASLNAAMWNLASDDVAPYVSMPLDAVAALGVESGKEVWTHAPVGLGFPEDMETFRAGLPEGASFADEVASRVDVIFASPAWDAWADEFVGALERQGYPEDRMIYVTSGNEIWNWGRAFFYGTGYGTGVGRGLLIRGPGNDVSKGYGALVARLKVAVDAALERAGRDQAITYVVERQQGTQSAKGGLNGAKTWLERNGENWDDHAPDFALAFAPYWKANWTDFASEQEWPKLIAEQPEETAAAFADFMIETFKRQNLQWAIAVQKDAAAPYGVRLLGAYEGGGHLRRKRYIDRDWYEALLWGPEGARVNEEVNVMLARSLPGFVISNYVLAGPAGNAPWNEGPLGADNPYAESWARIREKVAAE